MEQHTDKPKNPFRKDTLAWQLMEGDWKDLTVPQIAEVLAADVETVRRTPVIAESMTDDKHAPDFYDHFVPTEKEISLGDWMPGRYAWELANVKILPEPISTKGKQGLWNWEGTEK